MSSQSLPDAFRCCDQAAIIRSLIKLRKKESTIDRNTFEILIELIKTPNRKITDYALSILANSCVHENYRKLLKEMDGIRHVVLVYKNVDNDSISGRACRLFGNLAVDAASIKLLLEYDVLRLLLKSLERYQTISQTTISMTFRAISKMTNFKSSRSELHPHFKTLCNCLDSEHSYIVMPCLRLLEEVATSSECKKKCNLNLTKELLVKLVEKTRKEEDDTLSTPALTCLSHFICYHPADVAPLLEGSGVGGAFIQYLDKTNAISYPVVVLKAFSNLCGEGAIRRDVRVSGLLVKLLALLQHHPRHVKIFLSVFYHFLFDKSSMAILAHQQDFIPLLINNVVHRQAVELLSALPRVKPAPMELIQEHNLEVLLARPSCSSVLRQIVMIQDYVKPLLVSKMYWKLSRAGYNIDVSSMPGYIEELLSHLLSTTDSVIRENVALSVPFLLSSRDFRLQYKLLAHHHVLTTISRLLRERPTEERVLASIVQLIHVLGYTFISTNVSDKLQPPPEDNPQDMDVEQGAVACLKPNRKEAKKDKSEEFAGKEVKENAEITLIRNPDDVAVKPDAPVQVAGGARSPRAVQQVGPVIPVTFQLDDGSYATVNKSLLCANSPVLDAMLNGHFIESQQERVRLTDCSPAALQHLVMLLSNAKAGPPTSIRVYLELISLTDRFLIPWLHKQLCTEIILDKSTVTHVFLWCHGAVDTPSTATIKRSVHDFLLQTSDHLQVAMENETARRFLTEDLIEFLSRSVRDLL